jgi:hypothetical protein
MTLMTVNNHNEQGKDHRAQPRWSAGKNTVAVLRLLRGEPWRCSRASSRSRPSASRLARGLPGSGQAGPQRSADRPDARLRAQAG